MHSIVRAALGAIVGLAGVLAPLAGPTPEVLAATAPKVVLIVGPVSGSTPSYRSDAEAAATEALKYTSNVVTLYSPKATWDVVRSALRGASIVIYMGHGNGFPSPYSSSLQPDRQDGLGLNPTAGVDDSTTSYWGEQYLASEVKLAPNAVVLLGHLCYASGSSEPGMPDPTRSDASQRVDNFAAGFLAAGARAVFAEAYAGASAKYVDALFTAHATIGNIWAHSFSNQGNSFSFASSRTPGMTAQLDPDHASGKYYRAIVGDMSLSSDAVIGTSLAGPAPTPAPSPTPDPSNPAPSTPPPLTPSPTPAPVTGSTGSTPTPTPTPITSPPPSAGVASAIGSVRWTTTSVNVRGHPTTASKPLFVLSPGTAVTVVRAATDSAQRTWYLVRANSRRGWLAAWLTRGPTSAQATATDAAWQPARASSFGVGDGLLGSPMACGGTLTDTVMAVANRDLPCGTRVRIRSGGRLVEAQVLDRGPYVDGLTFDLGPAVCQALGACDGVTSIEWQPVT